MALSQMSARARAARRREPAPEVAETVPESGHNLPPGPTLAFSTEDWIGWLEHNCAILREREKELLASFGRFETGFPTIDNDDVQGRATDLANKLKDHLKLIESHHVLEKRPLLTATRAVDGWFKGLSAKLEGALPVINRRRTAYAEKIEAERRAIARAEADRLAAEAAAAAAQAIQHDDADALEAAARLGNAAQDAAETAAAKPAELSRVYSPMGGVASLTTRWKLDVEASDLMVLIKAIVEGKAPLDFVQLNTTRIGFAIRSEKLRSCPGLAVVEERKVT